MIRRDIIVSRKSLRVERPTKKQHTTAAVVRFTPKTARYCMSGRDQQSRSVAVPGLTGTTAVMSDCTQGMQELYI